MKLVVTIPALNEEATIGSVIRAIPRQIAGIDEVEVLVVADGCTDGTVREALASGAHRVVVFRQNRGLARAFRRGLEEALQMGADVIANIDADGQYVPEEMPKLVAPVVEVVAGGIVTW